MVGHARRLLLSLLHKRASTREARFLSPYHCMDGSRPSAHVSFFQECAPLVPLQIASASGEITMRIHNPVALQYAASSAELEKTLAARRAAATRKKLLEAGQWNDPAEESLLCRWLDLDQEKGQGEEPTPR